MVGVFPVTDVQTLALQVYIPSTYTGPQDVAQLRTVYLAYIPSDDVSDLSQQILAQQSAFYTGLPSPYSDLAKHVVATYPLVAAADANTGSGGAGDAGSGSAADNTGASSSSKTREDAIIGVVSSLGAITLIVLAFLVVRAVKQRRELAHRRLSDGGAGAGAGDRFVGARPDNQDFDRDSVGGQRRRSFYYAEDSLRYEQAAAAQQGWGQQQQQQQVQQVQQQQYEYEQEGSGMRERRPVNAGMISTPVLRENTMAW
ncbi:hypothetical protein EIP86_010620 [Pleurotus ostreatoroseus]|nr:hypothetical protein EIP86_010620 [Pleurotus ostreatoroseus]